MPFLGTYVPEKVSVIVGDDEAYGWADGSMITVEKEAEEFNIKTGTKGETTRTRIHNNNYRITMRFQQTSPFIKKLEDYVSVDNVFQIPTSVPIKITDPSSYEGFFSGIAWVQSMPSREWGDDAGVREYVFFAVSGVTNDEDIDIALNFGANLGIVERTA